MFKALQHLVKYFRTLEKTAVIRETRKRRALVRSEKTLLSDTDLGPGKCRTPLDCSLGPTAPGTVSTGTTVTVDMKTSCSVLEFQYAVFLSRCSGWIVSLFFMQISFIFYYSVRKYSRILGRKQGLKVRTYGYMQQKAQM